MIDPREIVFVTLDGLFGTASDTEADFYTGDGSVLGYAIIGWWYGVGGGGGKSAEEGDVLLGRYDAGGWDEEL